MSADSTVTYSFAPHSLEYVPRDHVPVFVPEFEHPEDLVPAKDEAPASLLPPGFLSPRIRPLSPRALGAKINVIASSLYYSLHPSRTPPLLPIPLSTPSTSRRAGILEADTPPRNRPLLATPRPGCEVGESFAAAARWTGPTMAHGKDRAAVRAEIKVLRSERLAYEQEGIQTREALARSEAYCRALKERVAVLETHARRLEQIMAPVTRQGHNPPPPNTNTPPHHMTPESVHAMIDQALLRNSTNRDGSQSSHEDNPRHVKTTRSCFYADFMKCHPLNFKGNKGVVGLTRWIKKMESVFNISGCAIENQVKFATCTLLMLL
nr:hypothetical protein [Tanacetum cinerariifolium]